MTASLSWIVPALALLAQQPSDTAKVPLTIVEGQPPAAPEAISGGAMAERIGCAPISLAAAPLAGLRVSGGYVHGRIMFGPGEPLIVNGGTHQGIQKGQRYFVRRSVHDVFTPASGESTPVSIHTAGWVTIVDVKDDVAVAQITHACDGILDGDYLEPYSEPVIPTALPGGAPDYEHPARIVLADEKQQTGAAGTLMLINRGTDHGIRAGAMLTIYRETLEGAGPVLNVGEGTILSVRPQTSLIRIDSSRDAVYVGDLAAIHRIQ